MVLFLKVVNTVNFFPTSEDCFTGEDITPDDFRLPFGITNVDMSQVYQTPQHTGEGGELYIIN